MQLRKGSRNKIIQIDGVGTQFINGYGKRYKFINVGLFGEESIKRIEGDLMWLSKNQDGTPNIDEVPFFIHGTNSDLTPRVRFNKLIAKSRYPNKGLRKKYDL